MTAPVFATFGCRLNAYETEAMKGLAAAAGLGDAVVVNSCAVTAEAVRQARQQIRRLRRDNPDARLVVTGCAAQTEPATFAAMPEVDLVLGNAEKLRPEAWARLAAGAAARVAVGDIMAERRPPAPLIDGLGTRARAYVQVQNGCDHRCTFCIIPYGRGNSRSVPAATVVEQVARLVDRGFNEVVLTGVDLTSWGADLDGAPRLGDLVAAVLRGVPDLPRLRLSLDRLGRGRPAADRGDRRRAAADAAPAPVAAGRRRPDPEADEAPAPARRRHRLLRGACARRGPDIVFGADIIAGFPTETEAMFENSLRLVEDCGLTWLHVFPFSAARRHAGGADAAGGRRRRSASGRRGCARSGAERVAAHLAAMQGRQVRLLMERPDLGRTEGFAQVRMAGSSARPAVSCGPGSPGTAANCCTPCPSDARTCLVRRPGSRSHSARGPCRAWRSGSRRCRPAPSAS